MSNQMLLIKLHGSWFCAYRPKKDGKIINSKKYSLNQLNALRMAQIKRESYSKTNLRW